MGGLQRNTRRGVLTGLLLTLPLFAFAPTDAVASAGAWSHQFAGYRLGTAGAKVLQASWVQPDLTCGATDSEARFELVLSNTTHRVALGTVGLCRNHRVRFYAWLTDGGHRQRFGGPVRAGDLIVARLNNKNHKLNEYIRDKDAGWGAAGGGPWHGPALNIATVAVAVNGQGSHMLPLADFGIATFQDSEVNGTGMSDLDPLRVRLRNGAGVLEATVSAFHNDGSFDVTRVKRE